jgi:hypothetical protein
MLILHAGASPATLEDVRKIRTPKATATHQPIAHHKLIELVEGTLETRGFNIIERKFGLGAKGQRMFGVLQVDHNADLFPERISNPEFALMVGIRNSHDKSMAAGLGLVSKVFVCDNMAFSADILLLRKHTSEVLNELPELIINATERIIVLARNQHDDFESFKKRGLGDKQADAIFVEALRRGALPSRAFEAAVREWDTPSHEDFKPRNLWSLFNAVTHALKTTSFPELGKRTQTLHALCLEVNTKRRN